MKRKTPISASTLSATLLRNFISENKSTKTWPHFTRPSVVQSIIEGRKHERSWQRCPTAAAPFAEPVRPDSPHQPAVESVEELSDVGPLVVVAPTTHNGVRLFYQLLSAHRSGGTGVVASITILCEIPSGCEAGSSTSIDMFGNMIASPAGLTLVDTAHITCFMSNGSTSSSTTITSLA